MARIRITEAAKRGYASKPTIYRRIKDGTLSAHQEGDKRVLDVADLVRVFGEPASRGPAAPAAPADVRLGQLEAENEALKVERDRLRRERDQAHQDAADERQHGRKREDELLDMLKSTQRLIEDQTKPRSLWQRLMGRADRTLHQI